MCNPTIVVDDKSALAAKRLSRLIAHYSPVGNEPMRKESVRQLIIGNWRELIYLAHVVHGAARPLTVEMPDYAVSG